MLGHVPVLEAYVRRCQRMHEANLSAATSTSEDPPSPSPPSLGQHSPRSTPAKLQPLAAGTEHNSKWKLARPGNAQRNSTKPTLASTVAAVKRQMARAQKSRSHTPTAVGIAEEEGPLSSLEAQAVWKALVEMIFFVTDPESQDPYRCEGLPIRSRLESGSNPGRDPNFEPEPSYYLQP